MSYRRRNSAGVLKWTVLTLLLATMTLVCLKIVGVIGWSWWVVTAPLTVPSVMFIALVIVCIFLDLLAKEKADDDIFGR